MANIAIWVRPDRPMADGKIRIFFRLLHNNGVSYRATNISVFPDEVIKSGTGYQVKDKRLALMLSQLRTKMELAILDMGFEADRYSSTNLIKMICAADMEQQPDFVAFSKNYIKSNFEGRKGSAVNYLAAIKRLCDFAKKDVIRADEITTRMLTNFEKWLRDHGMDRGVSLYLFSIKKLFKEMRLEYNDYDNDIVIVRNNPFEGLKIPKATTKRKKRTLTLEELLSVKDKDCRTYKDTFTRDMFMLSFYLVGMNSRDLYDCPAPTFGRIEYNRGKTKGRREDEAFISIKVEPEAQAIIDKYKGRGKKLLDLKDYVSFKQFNNILNKHLKNVAPGLFFYMGRHTWASMARNKCDVSKDDVAMALNHVDQALKTTDTYIETDWSIIDRANRKVLDYISQK